MDELDQVMVRCIRALCASELGSPIDFPFFHANYEPGEQPDAALLRLFHAERPHHDSDIDTVLVMCHG